ncbi:MAG: hypothetical protein V4858_00110 [Pseudomonadota bacterium]
MLVLLLALASLCAGLALAWHHPVWPLATVILFLAWNIALTWRWHLGLALVPAGVAFMHFSPWSGWIVFDEFDILLLGTLAAGYARLAWAMRHPAHTALPALSQALLLMLGGMALLSLSRAVMDAGGWDFDWFAGYTDALNSVRVIKSEVYALLCVPLLHQEVLRGSARAYRRMALGMVMGLSVVVLAVAWERWVSADLLDFSTPYRTVALFWEMHVGGEAIDAYLAMATPFAVWAVVSARRPLVWLGAAMLAVLTAYAVLTTFSRGLYFATLTSLLVLAMLAFGKRSKLPGSAAAGPQPATDWRTKAIPVLYLALGIEVFVVLGAGTFMLDRMARSREDFGSRVAHWQRGLAVLHGPTDWWLGKGPGRLPNHYANLGPAGEFSGQALAAQEQDRQGLENRFVTVLGPMTQKQLGGQFALTQRVPSPRKGLHVVRLDILARTATDLQLEWCARHLLYDADCRTAQLHVAADPAWRPLVQPLTEVASPARWHAPRLALFTVSVVNAGGRADIDNIRLQGPNQEELLTNGDFAAGLAHWLGSAQSYYLPWHIDNLFLEVLIERGLLGLLIFCALVATAMWRLAFASGRRKNSCPYAVAALTGALCVGLTGSVLDTPRVMFLFYAMALGGALLVFSRRAYSADMRKIKKKKNTQGRLLLP